MAIASDAPLLIGAVSSALSGVGSVLAVGPVLRTSAIHGDHAVWSADVVIVGVPGRSTFADIETSAVPRIAEQTSVVLLLTESLGHRVGDLLRLGLHGLLPDTCSAAELLDAVQHVIRGALYVAPTIGLHLAEQCVPGRLATALTPREREVLDLLARSFTYAEIAAHLLLSQHTVKFHVSNVLAKLGVTSRREAVARWLNGPFGPTALPGPEGSVPPAAPGPPAAADSYGEADRGDPARSRNWRTT